MREASASEPHRPDRSREFLAEVVRIQSYLAERRVFATNVIAGPVPIGRGHAIVEAFADIGSRADVRRPEIRADLTAGCHAIVRACDPLVEETSLQPPPAMISVRLPLLGGKGLLILER